ncbi:hypothetical protein H0H93_000256 [Arthromyces matolae]|nr:hypothetical protein H0H93_000256 [Arthromyces matolae]
MSPATDRRITEIKNGAFKASEHFEQIKGIRKLIDAQAQKQKKMFPKVVRQCMYAGALEVWLERDDATLFLRIIDDPGYLSGNILRLLVDLPYIEDHSEIIGNRIERTPFEPPYCGAVYREKARQDLTSLLNGLPIITFDDKIHYAKRCTYRSEVENLLQVKGLSPSLIEVLGRTEDGRIIFPLCKPGGYITRNCKSLATIKRWCIQLVEGLIILHENGILHRDLELRNLLVSLDGQTAIICDLEGHWGCHRAPELLDWEHLDPTQRPFTEKSDIYGFGDLLASFVIGCEPVNNWVPHEPPEPFAIVVRACKAYDPDDRPTLAEVKAMLEAMEFIDDVEEPLNVPTTKPGLVSLIAVDGNPSVVVDSTAPEGMDVTIPTQIRVVDKDAPSRGSNAPIETDAPAAATNIKIVDVKAGKSKTVKRAELAKKQVKGKAKALRRSMRIAEASVPRVLPLKV